MGQGTNLSKSWTQGCNFPTSYIVKELVRSLHAYLTPNSALRNGPIPTNRILHLNWRSPGKSQVDFDSVVIQKDLVIHIA